MSIAIKKIRLFEDLTDHTINTIIAKLHPFNLLIFSIINIASIIGFSINMEANGKFIG